MQVDLDRPQPFKQITKVQKYKKVHKYKSTHNSAIFLSYRLQILHGSSYGLSNQMTKYKSTKKTLRCQLLVQKSILKQNRVKTQKTKKYKNVKNVKNRKNVKNTKNAK